MSGPSQLLSTTVRRQRRARHLSLSELARSASISKSTLSEIERGQGNPSLDTLWSIAVALGIHLSDLFDDPAPLPVAVLRYADAPVIAEGEGGVTVRHLRNLHEGAIELYEVEFPGADAARDSTAHSAGQIEHVIVLEGRVDVGPDGVAEQLDVGDTITFPADVPHHYRAIGGSARILSIVEYRDSSPKHAARRATSRPADG